MLAPHTPLDPEISREQLLKDLDSTLAKPVLLALVIIDEQGDVYHHYHSQFDRDVIADRWQSGESLRAVAQRAADRTELGITVTGFSYLGRAGVPRDQCDPEEPPEPMIVVHLTAYTGTPCLDKVSRIGGRGSRCWAAAQAMWRVIEPLAPELNIRSLNPSLS